jgi:hypothetical protein
MGRAVHGASCPSGQLSMGRAVHGMSSNGVSCHGVSLYRASFDGAFSRWGELFGNHLSLVAFLCN